MAKNKKIQYQNKQKLHKKKKLTSNTIKPKKNKLFVSERKLKGKKYYRFSYSLNYLRYLTLFKNTRLSLYNSTFYNKVFIKYFWKNFYFILLYFYLYKKKKNQKYYQPKSIQLKKYVNFNLNKNYITEFNFSSNFDKTGQNQITKSLLSNAKSNQQRNQKLFFSKLKKLKGKYISVKNIKLIKKKKFIILNNKNLKLIYKKSKSFIRNILFRKTLKLSTLSISSKRDFLLRLILNLRKNKKKNLYYNFLNPNRYFKKSFKKKFLKKNKLLISWKKTKINRLFLTNKIERSQKRKKKLIQELRHNFYNTKTFLYFFLILFFIKKQLKMFISFYKMVHQLFDSFLIFYFKPKYFTKKNFLFIKQFYYHFNFLFKIFSYLKILFNSFTRYSIFIKKFFKFFNKHYQTNTGIIFSYLNTHQNWKSFNTEWTNKNYTFLIFLKFFFSKLWNQTGIIFQTINYLYFFFNKFLLIQFLRLKLFFFFKYLSFKQLDFFTVREYLKINIKWFNFLFDKQYTEYKLNNFLTFIWLVNEKVGFFNNIQQLTNTFNLNSKNILIDKVKNVNFNLSNKLSNEFFNQYIRKTNSHFLQNFFYYNTFNKKYRLLSRPINQGFIDTFQFKHDNFSENDLKQKYNFFRSLVHKKHNSIMFYDKKKKNLFLNYLSIFSHKNNINFEDFDISKKYTKDAIFKDTNDIWYLKNFYKKFQFKNKIWIPIRKIYRKKKTWHSKPHKKILKKRKNKTLLRLFLENNLISTANLPIKLLQWKINKKFSVKQAFRKSRRVAEHKLEPNWRYKLNYDIPDSIEVDFITLRILFLSYRSNTKHFLPFHHKLDLLMTSYRNYGF